MESPAPAPAPSPAPVPAPVSESPAASVAPKAEPDPALVLAADLAEEATNPHLHRRVVTPFAEDTIDAPFVGSLFEVDEASVGRRVWQGVGLATAIGAGAVAALVAAGRLP